MRDYLYVNDLLSFIDLAIKKQKENFQIFNCSYGKSFKIKEILQIILKISGSNKKIENISSEKNIYVYILVNSNKAKNIRTIRKKFLRSNFLMESESAYFIYG